MVNAAASDSVARCTAVAARWPVYDCSVVLVVQTELSRALWEGQTVDVKSNADFGMGPIGQPSDCAGAVAFLWCVPLLEGHVCPSVRRRCAAPCHCC